MRATEETKRVKFIDIARFYAMALVFYGHFIERMMILENASAAIQYRFIYSFHMVLFVVLAGYVAGKQDIAVPFRQFIRARFCSRLVPFLFFTVLFMVLPVFLTGDHFVLKLPSVDGYVQGLVLTAFGLPLFCVPSWFILMIFSIELIHFLAFRLVGSSNARILLAALVFYVAGYWLNLYFDLFNMNKGRIVGWNYLYMHEAITMYAFYLLGIFLRRNPALAEKLPAQLAWPAALLAIAVVYFTYDLNTGPFNVNYYNSVVIMFSSHGNFILFPITALAGSLFVILLARLTKPNRALIGMGQNTLLLIFLNGFFYHFLNPQLAQWAVTSVPGTFFSTLQVGLIVTVVSLVLCIPFIYFFNQYLPQLVGKPKLDGPLIRRLI